MMMSLFGVLETQQDGLNMWRHLSENVLKHNSQHTAELGQKMGNHQSQKLI